MEHIDAKRVVRLFNALLAILTASLSVSGITAADHLITVGARRQEARREAPDGHLSSHRNRGHWRSMKEIMPPRIGRKIATQQVA